MKWLGIWGGAEKRNAMSHLEVDCRSVQQTASDYLSGDLKRSQVSRVVDHLQECQSCTSFLSQLKLCTNLLGALKESKPSPTSRATGLSEFLNYYPEPATRRGLQDLTKVCRLWGSLSSLPEQERSAEARENDDYLTVDLLDWLLGRSKSVCSRSPSEALPLARLALQIAEERLKRFGDENRVARALAVLAWCNVSQKEYAVAEALLTEAEPICLRQSQATEERAMFLAAKGALLAETGRPAEAECVLRQALDVERKLGSRKRVIGGHVNLAWAAFSRGDVEKAVEIYRAAEKLLDLDKDSARLQLTLYGCLAVALCETGRTEEAAEILPTVRELSRSVGGWYWRVYIHWLTGTLDRCEGRYETAAETFEDVRGEFLQRGHLAWYLEASLDLARARFEQGKKGELEKLALELLEATKNLPEDHLLKTSMVYFASAVRQRPLSTAMFASVALALRSMRPIRQLSG